MLSARKHSAPDTSSPAPEQLPLAVLARKPLSSLSHSLLGRFGREGLILPSPPWGAAGFGVAVGCGEGEQKKGATFGDLGELVVLRVSLGSVRDLQGELSTVTFSASASLTWFCCEKSGEIFISQLIS